ncbi:hypothetical protein UlMin_007975 [Ulmus minor]
MVAGRWDEHKVMKMERERRRSSIRQKVSSGAVSEIAKEVIEITEPIASSSGGGDRILVEELVIFKHLTSLEVEDFKDVKSGYSISFNFSENPFFEDRKLTKTYTFLDEGTKITATPIKWKEVMGIPNGVTHEKKGKKRPLTNESTKCLGLYFFFYFSICKHQLFMKHIVNLIQNKYLVICKDLLIILNQLLKKGFKPLLLLSKNIFKILRLAHQMRRKLLLSLDVDKITQKIKSSVTTTLLDQTPESLKN